MKQYSVGFDIPIRIFVQKYSISVQKLYRIIVGDIQNSIMLAILLLASFTDISFYSNGLPTKANLLHTASSDFSKTVQTTSLWTKLLWLKNLWKYVNLDIADGDGNRMQCNLTENYNYSLKNLQVRQGVF